MSDDPAPGVSTPDPGIRERGAFHLPGGLMLLLALALALVGAGSLLLGRGVAGIALIVLAVLCLPGLAAVQSGEVRVLQFLGRYTGTLRPTGLRKAATVSNLLVVLCGERSTQPVVNTSSLYH